MKGERDVRHAACRHRHLGWGSCCRAGASWRQLLATLGENGRDPRRGAARRGREETPRPGAGIGMRGGVGCGMLWESTAAVRLRACRCKCHGWPRRRRCCCCTLHFSIGTCQLPLLHTPPLGLLALEPCLALCSCVVACVMIMIRTGAALAGRRGQRAPVPVSTASAGLRTKSDKAC